MAASDKAGADPAGSGDANADPTAVVGIGGAMVHPLTSARLTAAITSLRNMDMLPVITPPLPRPFERWPWRTWRRPLESDPLRE
jgi:hypothetical protein